MSDRHEGLFGTLRLMWDNRRETALFEYESIRGDRLIQEANNLIAENVVRHVHPETDGFIPIGQTGDIRELDATSATTLRDQARIAEYRSELLGGYLRTLKRFVVGQGPTFTPQVDDDGLKERIQAWWDVFVVLNQWDEMEDEIPFRAWRDGEVFQRYFVQKAEGPIPFKLSQKKLTQLGKLGVSKSDLRSQKAPKGMTWMRFVAPEDVVDPSSTFEDGIVTADGDSQTVLGFIVISKDNTEGEFVSISEMSHDKLNVDSDILRGRSSLEPLLNRDRQFQDWVYARLLLNLARSAIVLHKKVGGTKAQGQALRNDQQSERQDVSNDRRAKMFRAGTTITSGDNVSYELLSANLGAIDAASDGRMLQLTMAAASGMPEGMYTADWSNQNLASALVAQGPAYREFESWQDFWTPRYRQDRYRRVMVNAAKAEAIEGLSIEMAETMEIVVEWPDIEVRDPLKHAQANGIKKANGVLSMETWIKDDGRDFEVETGRLEADRQREIEFGIPFLTAPGGEGAE